MLPEWNWNGGNVAIKADGTAESIWWVSCLVNLPFVPRNSAKTCETNQIQLFIKLLDAPMDNMNKSCVLIGYPRQAWWAHLACSRLPILLQHKKNIAWNRLNKVYSFWTMLTVESKIEWRQSKERRHKQLSRVYCATNTVGSLS